MSDRKIRIIGCGSPLMGDDGVGIRVVEKLAAMTDDRLKDVEILDLGVCGLDMLPHLDGVDGIVMVDAVKCGHDIGTIMKMTGEDLLAGGEYGKGLSAHDVSVPDVMAIAKATQGLPEITVFGISIHAPYSEYVFTFELTPAVEAAMDRVIPLILEETARMKKG